MREQKPRRENPCRHRVLRVSSGTRLTGLLWRFSFVSIIATPLTHLHWGVAERGPVTRSFFMASARPRRERGRPLRPSRCPLWRGTKSGPSVERISSTSRRPSGTRLSRAIFGVPPPLCAQWATARRALGSGDATDPRACGAPRRATRPGPQGGAETEAMTQRGVARALRGPCTRW